MMQGQEKLLSLVDKMRGRKILIVGDVGLDEYVIGTVRRISPEAPVPVVEVGEEDMRLGLASNVAANISSLGGIPYLVGAIGNDQTGEIFKSLLRKNNCTSECLIMDSSRPTTRKLRVMAGQHHVVRVDFERKKFLTREVEERLIVQAKKMIPLCDGVILEDYAKGVLSGQVITEVIKEAHRNGKDVTLDPNKTTPVELYKGVDFLTPNTEEAFLLSGLNIDDLRNPSETLHEVGAELLKRLEAKAVIITRGKDGMSAFEKNGAPNGTHIPTFAKSVFDVTGAGDTVIGALTLGLTSEFSLEDSCLLANYAAGVVVGKIGCVSPTTEQLKDYIQSHQN